jgi:RHS repeat-associated protein
VNTSNVVVAEYSFDAWGRRRNPTDWSYTLTSQPALFAGRGFTSHEHLPWFNLINMNGRMYDPLVGRFLSPDSEVQGPTLTQSYNRYSYCLNNPLRYIDLTGNTLYQYTSNQGVPMDLNCFPVDDLGNGGGSGAGENWYSTYINVLFHDNSISLDQFWKHYDRQLYIRDGKVEVYDSSNYSYVDPATKGKDDSTNSHSYIFLGICDEVSEGILQQNPNGRYSVYEIDPICYLVTAPSSGGGYSIEMNRFAESPDATVSTFSARGPGSQSVTGYFLEPGGPSTTKGGLERRVPAGTYNVRPYHSPSLNQDVYILSNSQISEGRGILMHIGNYPSNTLGCLLPGSSYSMYNGNYAVWNSTITFNSLRSLLGTNKATLTISDINP